jgi:LEA14-like dessication related protein
MVIKIDDVIKKMNMKTLKILLCVAMASVMVSCDVARQAQGALNMVNCKYEYNSLTDVSVAGINVSQGLTLLDTPKILTVLTGGVTSVPLGFTVNLNVENPNSTEAILNGVDYILSIDGIQFTTGSLASQLSVPARGVGLLPLAMSFDVAGLLKGETRDAVTGAVKNLVGIGSEPTEVSLQIRPTFMVAGYKVPSPVYIPIPFSFGGKKG